MAVFTIEMNDEQAADIVTAFCAIHGFAGDPKDAAAFAQSKITEHMQRVVKGYKLELATAAAMEAVEAAVTKAFSDNPITVTTG